MKKSIPTGVVGMVLALLAVVVRMVVPTLPPDPRTTIALAALVTWLVGLIVSVMGISQNSGRWAGAIGLFLAAAYWLPASFWSLYT